MAHKLLIEFEIGFSSPLGRFLQPNEVIRSERAKLTLYVTNMGTENFLGGKVMDWSILFGPDRGVVYTSPTAKVDCGEIAPGHKVTLLSEEVVPIMEGLAWIQCTIEPNGEDKDVEYYQDQAERPLPGRAFINCFYVVNREMLMLTSALEELTSRLQRREEGTR